jgi:hypothetical protein
LKEKKIWLRRPARTRNRLVVSNATLLASAFGGTNPTGELIRTHESMAGHSGNMRPSVQRAVIPNIFQQSISNSGQSFFSWYGQTQGLLVRLSNLITKRSD